jgi:hypothetical protein
MSERWQTGFNVMLILIAVLALSIALLDIEYFENDFSAEDRLVEYATAITLLAAAAFQTRKVVLGNFRFPMYLGAVLMALLLLFGAGEEISWGQRIFNWESAAFFLERNTQEETNLHNLMLGDVKINKLIFGQLLTVALICYYLLLPFFRTRIRFLDKLMLRSGVPFPSLRHSISFIASYAIVFLIPSERKWEVAELLLAISLLAIILSDAHVKRNALVSVG